MTSDAQVSPAISVVGTLTVLPEHEEAFLALTAETMATVAASEPDTLLYVLHRHPTEPHTFFFIERYRNQDALVHHASTPYFQAALGQIQQWLATPPEPLLLQQLLPAATS